MRGVPPRGEAVGEGEWEPDPALENDPRLDEVREGCLEFRRRPSPNMWRAEVGSNSGIPSNSAKSSW